jgi:hypothetical protein
MLQTWLLPSMKAIRKMLRPKKAIKLLQDKRAKGKR